MADDEVPSEPVNAPETPPEPASATAPETAPSTAITPASETAPELASGAQPSRGLRRPWLIVGIAIVVLLVAIVGAVALGSRGGSSKQPTATLEPSDSAGENPFTDSVAVGDPPTFSKDVEAAIVKLRARLPVSKVTGTRVVSGTAPAAYGGNGAARVCDAKALVTYLGKNPGNATAWAKAVGINRRNLAPFVSALTPVVLLHDTRVTNHGYDNAMSAPRQSILEAGTAVMIDTTGLPRVVCRSGNPVSATRPIVITKTRGDAWSGFAIDDVTTVKAGPQTTTLTLMNTQTGKYYKQPTGTGSAAPVSVTGRWVMAAPYVVNGKVQSSTMLTASIGRPWVVTAKIPGENVVGVAWGQDKWVAVSNADEGGKGNHVLESTDLHTWKQVAAVPNRLSGIAYGNGRWTATALHTNPATGSGAATVNGVIYTSADGTAWTQAATTGGAANGSHQPVAYGNGEWLTVVGTDNATSGTPELLTYTSQDGQHWAANGGKLTGQKNAALAFGPRIWAIGATPATPGDTLVSSGTDGVNFTPSPTGLPTDLSAIASGNAAWMAIVTSTHGGKQFSQFATSKDAKTWRQVGFLQATITALAFGAQTAITAAPSNPA